MHNTYITSYQLHSFGFMVEVSNDSAITVFNSHIHTIIMYSTMHVCTSSQLVKEHFLLYTNHGELDITINYIYNFYKYKRA